LVVDEAFESAPCRPYATLGDPRRQRDAAPRCLALVALHPCSNTRLIAKYLMSSAPTAFSSRARSIRSLTRRWRRAVSRSSVEK
jgi:hypothetical protein